jgi:SAM-dependent methyltransferase
MHFTVEAQKFAKQYLSQGSIAIDATCGNGFDTLFLTEQVGGSGVVYGVDIQARAIENVRLKLLERGTLTQCRLVNDSHSNLDRIVDADHVGRVSVVMFNLGYLPFGDKTIVTTPTTTLAGLEHALALVKTGGLISILAYPGHAGGLEESRSVGDWIEQHRTSLEWEQFQDEGNANSPILWLLKRRDEKAAR